MSSQLIQQWLVTATGWQSRGRTTRSVAPDDLVWTDSVSPARQYSSTAEFTADWPSDATDAIVDLTGYTGSNFYAAINAMCNAASSAIIIKLPAGTYHLNSFPLAGLSGNVNFAFGFYHPKWRGFLGAGPGQTIIQMDANSMSTAQLDYLQGMTAAAFNPNQMGMFLCQPTGLVKCFFAGLTIQAADQQNLTTMASDLLAKGVFVPQPAPHHGLTIGPNKDWQVSYVELLGAGRAIYAAPPFEQSNFTSQYSKGTAHHVWSDGRRAASIDPNQPRRCNPWMGNSEDFLTISQSRLSYCNVSRLAINNQGTNSEVAQGPYTFGPGFQIDHIGNHNIDPNINGGNTLGGYSQAVCAGFESTGSLITFNQPAMSVDNPYMDGSISQHIGLNVVASVNPAGGILRVFGGTFKNTAFPWLDGWLCIRVSQTSHWYTDGVANTIFVYAGADNTTLRKTAWLYTGGWNQTAMLAAMVSAGVSPATHYLLRNTVT